MSRRRICFIASEVAPYAKTGGLGDVAGALPKYIADAGYDVRVFTPLYNSIDLSHGEYHVVDFLRDVSLQFGHEQITFTVLTTTMADSSADIYFIDCPRLYHRGTIYTNHSDEYLRFAFLCRAVIESCQRMGWSPNVFHCNDWQTALIPLYLKTFYRWDHLFDESRTVLTIHNIAYQGIFPVDILHTIGLADYRDMFSMEDLQAGIVNFMKSGIFYADLLTTVSRTYAREIQTDGQGAGLQNFLRWRREALFGIVNGVDYNEWNPEVDSLIPVQYSAGDLAGKEKDKQYLLERMELAYDPDTPVVGIVSRLTGQKGFELFFDILRPFLSSRNVSMTILGSGEQKYESFFTSIQYDFPGRVAFYRGFQNQLAHLIEAGADMFVMPSRFEPCGLNQIYSLRYGTIPIVRRTGGLADTVVPFDPATGEGTGFVFDHFTPEGLLWALDSAVQLWHNKAVWLRMMRSAMAEDYSWERQIREYLDLYAALGAE